MDDKPDETRCAAPYRRLAMDEGWMSRHGGAVRILSYELLGFKLNDGYPIIC